MPGQEIFARLETSKRARFLRLGCWAKLLISVVAVAAADWPQFLGPTRNPVAPDARAPLRWGDSENIRWRVALPGTGSSSPIVAHERVFLIGGRRDQARAIEPNGKVVWTARHGSNVGSPVLHEGHLYFAHERNGRVHCLNAQTGEAVYVESLPDGKKSDESMFYASQVIAGDQLYYVSRESGTYVLPAAPRFEVLAHNRFQRDESIANATLAATEDALILRTGDALYHIAQTD